ncbi:MAG: hypothetical protein M1813_002720, partial [Trichoglossum hirsutum]
QRLHDCINTDSLDTHCARSEAATSRSASPRSPSPLCFRVSTGNRLDRGCRLYVGRNTADERQYEDKLVRPALNIDTFNKEERQQQEIEAEGEVDKDDDEDDYQLVGDTYQSSKGDKIARSAKRQRPLLYSDSSPEPSHDKARSYSDSYSDDELNNTKSDEGPRPAKQKQTSSSYDGPTQWKHENYLQYRSSRQRKPSPKFRQHYHKSHSLLDQDSRIAAGSSVEGQLPSPAPSAPRATGTDVSPDYYSTSPRNVLSKLTKNSRAIDVRALASRRSEPPSSDDDSGLSYNNLESSSDDDGSLSEDKQGHSSMSKYSRWSDLDEQRLLAYKKEGKSWKWIFGKLPGRSRPAIRTRWNMVRPRGE